MRVAVALAISFALLLWIPWKSSTRDPFERREVFTAFARDVNPILEDLRPTAMKILASDPSDHGAVIGACLSQDDRLLDLRLRRSVIDDAEFQLARPMSRTSIRFIAGVMLDENYERSRCRDPRLTHEGLEPCSRWCLGIWRELADLVDAVHDEAKKVGVHIVQLRR